MNVTAYEMGGAGGTASNGANGGAGANISMTNAVNGSTSGILTLSQAADGGGGGSVSGGATTAGTAGDATSTLTTSNPGGGELFGTATATGGSGGSIDNGTGANGGNATATINLTNSASVMASALAHGGSGGAGTTAGTTGTANATATANETGAAIGQANATATGSSGNAVAQVNASAPNITVQLNATAPVDPNGASQVESIGSVSQAAPGFTNGLQSVSLGTALPDAADVATALSGKPNSTAAFANMTVLGLVNFGDAYSPNASASHTYTNSAVFNFSSLTSGPLELGMLESSATAGGFSSLQFTILEGSKTLLSDTFLTLASAQTFFNDNPFSLTLTGGQQSLTFDLALTTDIPGSAFDTEFLLGVTPVPEPSTWGMIGVGGVALLGIMPHRRKRPRRTQLTE